jgi:glycosyltransferase involved in cell wall biosynthesis
MVPDLERRFSRPPAVTFAIPAYKRPQLLAAALESIGRQQPTVPFEVLVCDDGALPETRAVVERCDVPALRYYINRPAQGAVANWNRCIQLAAGKWVTILHEDDLLYPWFLKLVAPRLRAGITAVAVRCVQGTTAPILAEPTGSSKPRLYAPIWFLKSSMTPFPGVVFSREIALGLGGFDVRQGGLADYAFWYSLAQSGPVETLPETAAFYRVNEGQWTESEWPVMLRRAHLLRLRIARDQLPDHRRLGRWLARFYTARMARSYHHRFSERPAVLARARQFDRVKLASLPSGWVWGLLKLLSRTRQTPAGK